MSEKDKVATFGTIAMGAMADRVPFTGASDPLGVTRFFSGVFKEPDRIRQGFVVMYNPQTHTASVHMSGYQSVWTCSFADEMLSYSYGFSDTCPPREGEFVLVWRVNESTHAGVIIGRIPYSWNFTNGDLYNDPDHYHRRLYTQLDGTEDTKVSCFGGSMRSPFDGSAHPFTHFRPTDIYPGEFAKVNQHNCGIKGGLFSATLLGGGASLRLSALTNAARLACEAYMRYSMLGSLHEFHNGRYLSSERNVAMYQEERLGGVRPADKVWTNDSEAPKGGENQTMRPRMKELSGFFGHLSSRFCLRPDPDDASIRVQGKSSPKEAGVSRETIDPSGQYRLSASGMLAIERTGRIPVPVRIAYPTDKNHDLPDMPQELVPFEHDGSDPGFRQLELFDRQAYDLKNQYARVDGLGAKTPPDYYVPQEEDLNPLDDVYDQNFTKSNTVHLKKYDKRRAGVYIGEDGSVIVRDAWGSEIVMLGGNVSISCAGNVMMLPGKTQLTIAGDDIVQKAQNSVDIHASKHDVRLSAARNMEILGGADEKSFQGGVVIESRGSANDSAEETWDGSSGEDARLSGITLRSRNNRITMDGRKINIRSIKDTRLVSGENDIDGRVSIGAKSFKVRSDMSCISNGTANLRLVGGTASLSGRSASLMGESGVNITKGSDILVPLKWQKGDTNLAADAISEADELTKEMSEEETASDGMDLKTLDKMSFGFRSSEQCGTDKPWNMGTAGGEFRMYEPAWVQVMNIYETLVKEHVEAVTYEEKAEWKNGRPFPGEDAEKDGKYIELEGLKPENLTDDGFNKDRGSVKPKSSISKKQFDEGYLVRKQ